MALLLTGGAGAGIGNGAGVIDSSEDEPPPPQALNAVSKQIDMIKRINENLFLSINTHYQ
jgi:hypothetical protein